MTKAARVFVALGMFVIALGCGSVLGADEAHLRLGLVKFGSAAWEIDVMRHHGFDRDAGIAIDTVDLANPGAGDVALQAGGADAIYTDWIWVSRQRSVGQRVAFVPHFSALGEIMVAAGSPVRTVADLDGKRLGVAGGPEDKSWLVLRAYGRHHLGYDLAGHLQPVYAAPPLLSRELAGGRLDAVLTYWPFAARLAAQGYRSVAGVADIMKDLGFAEPVPLLGFGVSEAWIAAHPGGMEKFLSALARADEVMLRSDDEWLRLRPLTAAEDDATLLALRSRFRAGLSHRWGRDDEAAAGRLLALMTEDVGSAQIPAGTFWTGQDR